jgi:L-ascorbate metabolism protein UlaG (beta-lactamase superfamily)
MQSIRRLAALAVAAIAFAGCGSSAATSTPVTGGTPAPAAAKGLTISYAENAQVELTSQSGKRILIDVFDPTSLTSQTGDILLVTHLHGDHYNAPFADAFKGQKIVNQTTELTSGDIKIKSIAASHDDTAISETEPANHILIVEFDGFKIVHLGSTGQLALTPEQLAAIGGDVDIAIGAIANVGGNDLSNRKAVDVMNQIHPKLVIPTHSTLAYIQVAGKEWKATYSSNPSVTIPHDELPTETTLFCMGLVAGSYGAILNVPESTW